jgi:hypothetical protein
MGTSSFYANRKNWGHMRVRSPETKAPFRNFQDEAFDNQQTSFGCRHDTYPRANRSHFTVVSNQTVRVDVDIDTGIRWVGIATC